MEAVPRLTRCCNSVRSQFVEIRQRVTEQPRVLVDNLAVPEVGIVAVRAQEVVLVERRALQVEIRQIRRRVDAAARFLAQVPERAGIEEDTFLLKFNKEWRAAEKTRPIRWDDLERLVKDEKERRAKCQ